MIQTATLNSRSDDNDKVRPVNEQFCPGKYDSKLPQTAKNCCESVLTHFAFKQYVWSDSILQTSLTVSLYWDVKENTDQ